MAFIQQCSSKNIHHSKCYCVISHSAERTNKVNLLASPDDGVTVLHDAVVNNHLSVVKLLVQAGGEYSPFTPHTTQSRSQRMPVRGLVEQACSGNEIAH